MQSSKKSTLRILYGIMFILICTVFANAQKQSWNQRLPLNQKIKHGVLKNKLHYYILNVDQPDDKVMMELLVGVGGLAEEHDQVGMAHLIEHLGCRSTKHFPSGVHNFFKERGLVLGADMNAATPEESTRYYFSIPSKDTFLIRQGLLALSDMAGRMSFIPKEVEEERHAVFHEGSGTRSSGTLRDLADLRYKLLGNNPLYKVDYDWMDENIFNASTESMMRFYRDWYHPVNQVVIVVGNVDEDTVEKNIEKFFNDLSNDGAKKRINYNRYSVKLNGDNRLLIGRSMQVAKIELYKKRKAGLSKTHPGSLNEYKVGLMDDLVNQMLKTRRIVSDSPKPVMQMRIERSAIRRQAQVDSFTGHLELDSIKSVKPIVHYFLNELRRIELHGFSQEELSDAKRVLRNSTSSNLADDVGGRIIAYHTLQKAYPGDEDEIRQMVLHRITIGEINSFMKEWVSEPGNLDVTVETPDASSLETPTDEELEIWIQKSKDERPAPFILPVVKRLPEVLTGVNVKNCVVTQWPNLDAVQMRLPNGMTVILKDLPNKPPGKILISGFKILSTGLPEGSNQMNLKAFLRFDSLSVQEIENLLSEKRRSLEIKGSYFTPYVSSDEVGIEGGGDPQLVLQLASLYLTQGQLDRDSYNRYITEFGNPEYKNIATRFADTVQIARTQKPLQGNASTSQLTFGRLNELYDQHLKNASGFNIVIAGSFNMEDMKGLVARYLGALPEKNLSAISKMALPEKSPQKIVNVSNRVEMSGNSKGKVDIRILFKGDCNSTLRNNLKQQLLAAIAQNALFERLRTKEKGVYTVHVQTVLGSNVNQFFVDVGFETSPADSARLTAAVKDEIQLLSKNNIVDTAFTPALSKVRNKLRYEDTDEWQNAKYLLDLMRKQDLTNNEGKPLEILESITADELHRFIRDHLEVDNYMLFKLQ